MTRHMSEKLLIDPSMLTTIQCRNNVQMSVSSFGTRFVKQSLLEMVIFPVKTAPILHLWLWILGG